MLIIWGNLQVRIGIWMLVFQERGKLEYPEKNLSGQGREPTTNSTQHLTPGLGVEPRPHWWKASALTTVPSVFPKIQHFTENSNTNLLKWGHLMEMLT